MERDIEILFEIIADNLNLLDREGDCFDSGLFEEICDNLGFDLAEYIRISKNVRGRFRCD